jgi:aldehyde:ferredoxin oxidoreductase
VNLTTREFQPEPIDGGDVERFLGGRGLGAAFLFREMAPGIEALSPENMLIFSTGPVTGTNLPGASKHVVQTKSPLTGIYLVSISSRHFGPELRRCGYDLLIVEGRADKPTYLVISDEQVEFRSASHLWGLTTDHTEALVQQEAGSQARVACIGPAGENLVRYASIINQGRAAGRGGAGAVMGSKNLKAIAVRGGHPVHVADPAAYKALIKRAAVEIQADPKTEGFKRSGTVSNVEGMNALGIMPFRNWQETQSLIADKISSEVMRDHYLLKSTNCHPCLAWCTKLCAVKGGHYAGALSEGPEYETLYAFGGCCELDDFGAIVYLDSFCDRYGLDTISTGVTIGFAMECFQRGLIGPADTNAVKLHFGDHRAVSELVHDIVYRRGFGDALAEGTRHLADQIGQNSRRFAMHVNGLELGGYDPRGAKAQALVYACGPRGGCHHASGFPVPVEIAKFDRFAFQGKGALAKSAREDRVLIDSAILCAFNRVPRQTLAELLSAATGLSFSSEQLLHLAERVSNIERAFNVREGLRREADTLPERLLETPSAGQVVELDALLDDFYAECGWDLTTGIPTPDRLRDLELDEVVAHLETLPAVGSGS